MILCDIVNGYSLMQIYTKREELPPPHLLKYDNKTVEGVSKCDFAMSRDVACRVSMFATIYKTFNINSLSNQTVETQNFASLLPH